MQYKSTTPSWCYFRSLITIVRLSNEHIQNRHFIAKIIQRDGDDIFNNQTNVQRTLYQRKNIE